jgi:iron(III) transport system substrate-binding protein
MRLLLSFTFIAILFTSCGTTREEKKEESVNVKEELVKVYSSRHYDADKELYKKFETETGIKVLIIKDKDDALLARIQSEGKNCPGDLLITSDVGRLYFAKQLNLFDSVQDELIEKEIPANYRDEDKQWFGLTKRARVIVYATDRIDSSQLSTYEDLASPNWKGKIAVRSSNNIYNQSLLAKIISHNGEEDATTWAKEIVSNFSREPSGNDRDQIKEVALGNADVAVVNTYYLGKLLNSDNPAEREAGKSVSVFFPNQKTNGTHINISGAGFLKHGENRNNAIKLIQFLASESSQKMFATANYEYPVHENVSASELLISWGSFTEDSLSLNKLGEFNQLAKEVFQAAEWK